MNQVVTTLTAGGEPDTPLDDSIPRQFAFAHGDRVAWMARATAGPPHHDLEAHPINRHER